MPDDELMLTSDLRADSRSDGSAAWIRKYGVGKDPGRASQAGRHAQRTHAAALDRASDLTEQLRTPAHQHHRGARAADQPHGGLADPAARPGPNDGGAVARDTRASNRLIEPPR
jgi:hypothetical protein